jgi:hypothetical protein
LKDNIKTDHKEKIMCALDSTQCRIGSLAVFKDSETKTNPVPRIFRPGKQQSASRKELCYVSPKLRKKLCRKADYVVIFGNSDSKGKVACRNNSDML